MFGNDHYSSLATGQQVIPIRIPGGVKAVAVNILIVDNSNRCTTIVVEYKPSDLKMGAYVQDLYYNGSEECFKILSETGYNNYSWETEDMGITPEIIKKGKVDNKEFFEYIKNK